MTDYKEDHDYEDDKYCDMCGHYVAVPYTNTQCGCDCHEVSKQK